MFEVPVGTCMVIGSPMLAGDPLVWRYIRDAFGLHPASWYHWQGYARGVWAEYKGMPIARCMQYRVNPKMGWTHFGDIKAINWYAHQIIKEAMASLDLTHIRVGLVTTMNSYKVPGVEVNTLGLTTVCPLPHCDMQHKDFSVTYSDATKEFTFYNDKDAPKGAFKINSTYDHDGWLRVETVKELKDELRSH